LPGVGPYTAAAITSIAFGAPVAVVDGNVVRILARLTADGRTFRDGGTAAREFAVLAQALLPADLPGDHNQAMMELGATVCVRQNPRCADCPVSDFCAGQKSGFPESFPRLTQKKSVALAVTRVWCERAGRLLLHRTDEGARRLAALHELPTPAHLGLVEAQATTGKMIARRQRSITKYRITETIFICSHQPAGLRAGLVWVPLGELDGITLSGPHRRWVGEILRERG